MKVHFAYFPDGFRPFPGCNFCKKKKSESACCVFSECDFFKHVDHFSACFLLLFFMFAQRRPLKQKSQLPKPRKKSQARNWTDPSLKNVSFGKSEGQAANTSTCRAEIRTTARHNATPHQSIKHEGPHHTPHTTHHAPRPTAPTTLHLLFFYHQKKRRT